MPAHKKPSNVLKLTGAMKNHPARYKDRKPEPTLRPLGPPPQRDRLSFEQAWSAVVACAPPHTLFQRDRLLVEECAVLLQTLRNNGNEILLPVLRRFERCLTLLGLTPSDGARICASPPPTKNAFDDV